MNTQKKGMTGKDIITVGIFSAKNKKGAAWF